MDRLLVWMQTDGRVWFVIAGAAIVKALLSERLGWKGVAVSFAVAFFSGWIFPDPIMRWLDLNPSVQDLVVVACALTGEAVMRGVIIVVNDPEFIRDIIRRQIGGDK